MGTFGSPRLTASRIDGAPESAHEIRHPDAEAIGRRRSKPTR
jgi:hypothetical protein